MNEQYGSLDQNNKLIWNLRDIGHTMRQIFDGRGSQKRILILLRETAGMTQKELTSRLGVQPGYPVETTTEPQIFACRLMEKLSQRRQTANALSAMSRCFPCFPSKKRIP